MKRQPFRLFKGRPPIRRSAARIQLSIEELETRLLPSVDVLTYQYGTTSSGINANETQLTPANVSSGSFGKLFRTPLDGQVYGQPLVDTGVAISAGPYTTPGAAGVHDVVFVATENDTLYAIDADSSSTGAILWQRSFLNANDPNDALAGAASVTAVPYQDSTPVPGPDIVPTYGITSTPVIDPNTNTLYVITDTKEIVGGVAHYVQRLHAINLADGTDVTTSFVIGDTTNDNDNNTSIYVYGSGPGSVTDPYNGTGQSVVQFNALHENPRAALRLVNGTLYAAWSSHNDLPPYYGWVVGWNVSNVASNGFQLAGVFNAAPNGGGNGIWQAGGGLTFTPDGSAFYFVTGNSDQEVTLDGNGLPTGGNYNEAVVKATLDPSTSPQNQNANGWGFQVVNYFIPAEGSILGEENLDLSTGAALLPSSAGIPGHPNLLIAGDKAGQLFLLDRDNLGGFDPTNQNLLNAATNSQGNFTAPSYFQGVLSNPIFFNGQLYVVGSYSDPARSFTINSDGTLSQVSQTPETLGFEPGSPVLSANGSSNGIVWIMDRATNELHAYSAGNLGNELWSSGQGADALGSSIKFASPTVANGMVFVGTANSLVVYGLTAANSVSQAPSLSATALSATSVNLSWQDPSLRPNIASVYLIEASTDGVNFTQVTTAPQAATSLTIGGLTPGITYSFRIRGLNSLGASAYSNVAVATATSPIDFGGGFANSSGPLTYNGSAFINGTSARLTDSGSNEAGSVFTSTPVDINAFTTDFNFQVNADPFASDGFTFTIQGTDSTALGPSGGGLGYGPDGTGGSGGIPQSVAVKFDLHDNEGEGNDSTGLYTDGAAPTIPAIDLTGSGIDLHSGDLFHVHMAYNGTTLMVVITDTNTGASATQSYTVNIPSLVGGDTAYVGFTGGTGGDVATQDILAWTFGSPSAQAPALPVGLHAASVSGHAITLAWTNGSSNQIGFYLDRATDPGFTQHLITEILPGAPSSFTDTANGLVPGGTYYYRLRAFNSAGSSANTATLVVTIPLSPSNPGGSSNASPPANPLVAFVQNLSAVLPSLFQLEVDAFLLRTYINLASSGNGQSANGSTLNARITQLWSAIVANPLTRTPLGLYAIQQGFAQAQPSGKH